MLKSWKTFRRSRKPSVPQHVGYRSLDSGIRFFERARIGFEYCLEGNLKVLRLMLQALLWVLKLLLQLR